ncbi:hypothetical protein AB4Z54_41295, partial [Streptomyces sp. MCAF7]
AYTFYTMTQRQRSDSDSPAHEPNAAPSCGTRKAGRSSTSVTPPPIRLRKCPAADLARHADAWMWPSSWPTAARTQNPEGPA